MSNEELFCQKQYVVYGSMMLFSYDAPVLSPVGLDGVARLRTIFDADTLEVVSRLDNDPQSQEYRFHVRIKAIDCPEMKDKDPVIAHYAHKARDRLSEILNPKNKSLEKEEVLVHLEITKLDKYALRYIGNVWPMEGVKKDQQLGDNVSTILLREGFAKPYDGKKKEEWTRGDIPK